VHAADVHPVAAADDVHTAVVVRTAAAAHAADVHTAVVVRIAAAGR